ncbi:MAG TPA: hypothetical protein VL947_06240 [Cytophagales bacterium]|nr:hypothetical protein [Cytophagales bacterium]
MDDIKVTKDKIYSNTHNRAIASIDIIKIYDSPYHYKGIILHDAFPTELKNLIKEYYDLLDDCILSHIDEVEEKIMNYELSLQDNNLKIFRIELMENNKELKFFTKYPTANGFVDDYPFTN